MRSTNTYIKDLHLPIKGSVDVIDVETQNPNVKFHLFVEKLGYDEYAMVGLVSFSKDLKDLLDGRYIGEVYDKETIDVRLRDAQYEVRKEARKEAYKNDFDRLLHYAFSEGNDLLSLEHKVAESAGTLPEKEETEVEVKKAKPEKPSTPKEVEVKEGASRPSAPKPSTSTETFTPPAAGSLEGMIYGLVAKAVNSGASQEMIKRTVLENIGDWKPETRSVEVKFPSGEVKAMGKQHKDFETVLLAMRAGVNLALVGPAGSGKTTAVAKSADALGLPFYTKSVSAQTGVHEFFGYQDANGNYVRTLFREAYEFGGVFLLDEFDAGNPNVLAALNQATGNDSCAFADGMIPKHDNFLVVMAGNTFGQGATADYVGRNKIDKATLDRFAFLSFGYDEKFERDLAPNIEWAKKVQKLRALVAKKRIKSIISPRATFDGAKLLEVGLPEEKVLEMVVYKDMTPDEIAMIS